MKTLSQQYHFKLEVASADIDERAIRFEDPEELVLAISRAKADALVQKLGSKEESYLITADQVVDFRNLNAVL